jgi:hypothetical protein
MMNNTPPTPAAPPPGPLAKPKKNRTNQIIIGATAAVIAAIVVTGILVVQTRNDGGNPSSAASRSSPSDDTAITEEEPEPDVRGLQDKAVYETGVEVTLSDYKRGTSSANAAPANTPYVSFTVKIENKSKSALNVATGYLMCYHGDESQESRQVFDEELHGLPSMQLRPGRTAKTTVACEMSKEEKYLQVELTPSTELPKTIFAGDVK